MVQQGRAAQALRVPRASGDEPEVIDDVDAVNTCSPRERG